MANEKDERLARWMRVRLADERPHKHWFVPFGPYHIPRRFFAEIDDSRYPKCELEIEVVDGKPICVGIRLTSRNELTRTLLRQLPPLTLLVRQASAAVERDKPPHPRTVVPPQEITRSEYERRFAAYPKIVYRRGQRISDEHLEQVAEIYRRALLQRENPVAAIAKAIPTSRPTAGRWVMQARERGFLGRAIPRQAGERPSRRRKRGDNG